MVGHDNVMVPLSEAEFNTDGGVGLPYKLNPGQVYKEDYLQRYGDKLMDSVAQHPAGYSLPWDCFPKVEILPYEKSFDKARIICGAPVEHFLIGARLYTQFNKKLVERYLDTPSVVGLVVSHGGWYELYKRLPYMCENSDASRFDKSISPKLLKLVYMLRERLSSYSTYESKVHWWYFEHLCRRRSILSCGHVYLVHGGNGSGQYNTTIDNTLAHIIALAYASFCSGMTFKQFKQLKVFVYGDDYIGEALPGLFWEKFYEMGFVLNKTHPQNKLSCDFLSSRFIQTPYGITAIPIHDKGLYSLYTADSKRWREYRDQKAYSLWLNHFFHNDRVVYEDALTLIGVPFSSYEAINYWFGRLGGFKNL